MEYRNRVLIVDDELQCRSLISKLLSTHFPHLVLEEADSVALATSKIYDFNPNLIFLDIQMRGETGFDLLDNIKKINCGIIFTTAHTEFAVKAFRYSAMDYLMKPLDTEEFKIAVAKVLQRLNNSDKPATEQIELFNQLKSDNIVPDTLTIPTAEGFLFVKINDIIYCHALGNYTEFHLINKQKLLSSHTLGYYNELLAEQNFFRIHRSYFINLAHIKMYKKGDGGVVVMNNGEQIEVSRSNKESFLKLLKL